MIFESGELVSILRTITSGNYSMKDVNEIIRISQSFTITRLKQLFYSGKVYFNISSYSFESLALDCISHVFRRDDSGRFIEIIDYFSDERDLEKITADDATAYFTAFLFSKLQSSILRLYREYDPILSKIYRNLKISVRKNQDIIKFERFDELHIYSCELESRDDHLPEYPIEEIQPSLVSEFGNNNNASKFLNIFLKNLNRQDKYRKFYSLMKIAMIYKNIALTKQEPTESYNHLDQDSLMFDVSGIINRGISETKNRLYHTYVNKNKISSDEYDLYFEIIKDILTETYIHNNGIHDRIFDYFKKYFPMIEIDEWKTKHRNKFEYLLKTTKNDIHEELKEFF